MRRDIATPVEDVRVSAFRIPTDAPEADGTFAWDATTMVLVEVSAGGRTGMGYTYAAAAAAGLVRDALLEVVKGADAMAPGAAHAAMARRIRNLGSGGLARMALSAVDCALWDLKARLLDLPLVTLIGQVRETLPIYGSGGFTSYDDHQLSQQLGGWVEQGIPRVKMKVGADPADDPRRVRLAREAIGADADLMVDGNNAFDRKNALRFCRAVEAERVTWFEQPLPLAEIVGARALRSDLPDIDIADGEYAAEPRDFLRLLRDGVADVLMPDITRCGGVTGFLETADVCAAHAVPISTHCAPALHLHPACAVPGLRHAEWFHDHARIERMFFDGFPEPAEGALWPDLSRPGHGLVLRRQDAPPFQIDA